MSSWFLAAILAGFLFSGCVTPFSRTNPIATVRSLNIKRVVLLPPKIDVFELGAGGVKEKIDDWSQKASDNIAAALIENLGAKPGVQAARFSSEAGPPYLKAALTDTDLLYDAVNRSILLHSYGQQPNYFEGHPFQLSLGQEISQLKISEADAFILVRGSDEISSAGRKALQGATMIAAAALGVIVIPQPGFTMVSMALVDANDGTLLWHALHRGRGGTDLREPASAASMVRAALADFPVQ